MFWFHGTCCRTSVLTYNRDSSFLWCSAALSVIYMYMYKSFMIFHIYDHLRKPSLRFAYSHFYLGWLNSCITAILQLIRVITLFSWHLMCWKLKYKHLRYWMGWYYSSKNSKSKLNKVTVIILNTCIQLFYQLLILTSC